MDPVEKMCIYVACMSRVIVYLMECPRRSYVCPSYVGHRSVKECFPASSTMVMEVSNDEASEPKCGA